MIDQAQLKALNALEPFLVLAKSATSARAAAQVIAQATSASSTFVFAELLQHPRIRALANSEEYSVHLDLLKIFSYGVWSDHAANKNLPTLSHPQARKLRQLSLLTLATTPAALTYANLLQQLCLPDHRALEDIIISTIYAGLITARLNTTMHRVEVSCVAALRDLRPGHIPHMIDTFGAWDRRCAQVLEELEGKASQVHARAAAVRRREDANSKAIAALLEEKEAPGPGPGPGTKGPSKVAAKRAVDNETDDLAPADARALTGGGAAGRTRSAKRGGKGLGKR